MGPPTSHLNSLFLFHRVSHSPPPLVAEPPQASAISRELRHVGCVHWPSPRIIGDRPGRSTPRSHLRSLQSSHGAIEFCIRRRTPLHQPRSGRALALVWGAGASPRGCALDSVNQEDRGLLERRRFLAVACLWPQIRAARGQPLPAPKSLVSWPIVTSLSPFGPVGPFYWRFSGIAGPKAVTGGEFVGC